jgi:hypothetical protein
MKKGSRRDYDAETGLFRAVGQKSLSGEPLNVIHDIGVHANVDIGNNPFNQR